MQEITFPNFRSILIFLDDSNINLKKKQTELRVDNVVKGKQLMHIGSGAGIFASTRNILCTVNKADHVWTQTRNTYGINYFNYLHGGVRSSFVGLFIQEP